jgi:predicted phage terminase large subunit-like protein
MLATAADIRFDETDVMRSIVQESFFDFVKEFWDVVCAEKPVWNWHIPYLCSELEYVIRRAHEGKAKEYDLVINISPGSTKSIVVSIMLPAWAWTWWPSASFIGSSYTYALAVTMSRKNRAIVKSEKYQDAFPDTLIIDDQDSKGHFVNVRKGERMCAGIDGDIIGRHADCILVDDPLKPKGARSEAELESANMFVAETLWSRKKNKEGTPTILIMQRLHENDPSGMLLKRFGSAIKHICLPAELTDSVRPVALRKNYVDGLMDPARLSRKVLDEEKKLGEFYYAGQFLQNPVPLGGGMFKSERIAIDVPSRDGMQKVRYWDKAGSANGGAYTAGVLMGKQQVNGTARFWILDVVRGQWESAAREARIKQVAQMDGLDAIIGIEQEPGSGGKDSALATARNLAGFRVRLDKPSGDKALRADPLSAQVNAGNVAMVRGPWNGDYLNEMAFFPASTFKDQIDASSGAFKLLTKPQIVAGGWKL